MSKSICHVDTAPDKRVILDIDRNTDICRSSSRPKQFVGVRSTKNTALDALLHTIGVLADAEIREIDHAPK